MSGSLESDGRLSWHCLPVSITLWEHIPEGINSRQLTRRNHHPGQVGCRCSSNADIVRKSIAVVWEAIADVVLNLLIFLVAISVFVEIL